MSPARALAAIACTLVLCAAAADDEALKPYLGTCDFPDELRVVSAASLPTGMKARSVHTADGVKTISVMAGTRLTFGYPGTDPFTDVRVEVSAPDRYAADKATIVRQMRYIAASSSGPPAPIVHEVYQGRDHFELDDLTINHSPIALHTFFDDARHVVITIYFLNAEPSRRKYASMDEFRQLRDRFIGAWFACVRRNGG